MFIEEIQKKIESAAKRVFEEAGMDLIELKVKGHKNDVHIQIAADKPSGGITITECVLLNKALAAAIRQEDLLTPGTFSLEVSSPGIDRPHQ
jgi:ribosome maturation factor RimP